MMTPLGIAHSTAKKTHHQTKNLSYQCENSQKSELFLLEITFFWLHSKQQLVNLARGPRPASGSWIMSFAFCRFSLWAFMESTHRNFGKLRRERAAAVEVLEHDSVLSQGPSWSQIITINCKINLIGQPAPCASLIAQPLTATCRE